MRDRIWGALWQAKTSHIYCDMLVDYYKNVNNISNILIDVFSAGGVVMGLGFWKMGPILPVLACGIIAIIQTLKRIMPKLIPSDKQFKNLSQISKMYVDYHNELEKFWYAFESKEFDEKAAREAFYKIQEADIKIKKLESDTLPKEKSRIQRKAEAEKDKYYNNNFKSN